MNACHRGCRLYSICQFVNGNAGFNTSKEECQGGEANDGSNQSILDHQTYLHTRSPEVHLEAPKRRTQLG